MTFKWVDTSDILMQPEHFSNKLITLGFKYSLVCSVPNQRVYHECLDRLQVHEIIYLNNCYHVLVHCSSLQEFYDIRDRFKVNSSKLPDSGGVLDHYIITALLPDNVKVSFNHAVCRYLD